MLGHWKDYEELESSLSMPELLLTLEAMHKTERRNQKFMAALQGVDLDKDESSETTKKSSGATTIEEVKARAMARLTGDTNLAGAFAEGLTPDKGVEYKIMGGTEIG